MNDDNLTRKRIEYVIKSMNAREKQNHLISRNSTDVVLTMQNGKQYYKFNYLDRIAQLLNVLKSQEFTSNSGKRKSSSSIEYKLAPKYY